MFKGRNLIIATKHSKEKVIAPIVEKELGVNDVEVKITAYAKDSKGNEFDRFIFANGGDQNRSTIGETRLCEELGIELADGLGDKIQSSSWLLNGKQ